LCFNLPLSEGGDVMSSPKRAHSFPVPSGCSYNPSLITKSISAGLSILDKKMRIIWVNKTHEKWFAPLNTIKGKHCFNIYEKKPKICPGCPSIKIFKYNLDKCTSIRRNIFIKGKRKHFKLTATPIRDDKGKVIQVLESVEDVTEEVKLEQQARKRLNRLSSELEFFSKLDRQFIYSTDFSMDKILNQSIEIAPILLGSEMCNLRLLDNSKNALISRANKGISKDYANNVVMPIGEGIAGRVAATKKPLIVEDALSDQNIKFMQYIKKEGIRSCVCVPIILKKDLLGTLTVYDRKINAFTKHDCKILLNFANHIAILIDNVKMRKKIFVSYINTIKALVSAVEARDVYTRGHSEKVTKFALDIANAINLPKYDKIMLSYCGRLHDIGKIAISDLILNKPGPLTIAEKAEIQTHPAKGVDILSNLKFLEDGIPVIRHHHERYDGRGYPDKLKGKDTPLLARIIGCADAFDAMTSDRPYRPRMAVEKALLELRTNKKKQFDPEIVDVFIDTIGKTRKDTEENIIIKA